MPAPSDASISGKVSTRYNIGLERDVPEASPFSSACVSLLLHALGNVSPRKMVPRGGRRSVCYPVAWYPTK